MSESLDLGSLIEEFRDEARDQVDDLDAGLLQLEREGRLDEQARSGLLRVLHTLKGNAGMLGLGPIRDFVHVLENALKEQPGSWSEGTVERLFGGAAALRRAVEVAGGDEQEAAFRDLTGARHRLEELEAGEPAPAPAPEVEKAEEVPEPAVGGDRLRVPFAKLDTLLNQVGELIGEADALQAVLAAANGDRDLEERARRIRRRTGALQDSVMSLRLVPIGRVLTRFHSLVRRLARDQDKEVRLVVRGEDTEVDKSTADSLSEPLLHLLRNAIDHGIQKPEVREAGGKPPYGTIRLDVSRDRDQVQIVVEDDGAGLDLERIDARARESGLIEEGTDLGEEELINTIFRPGFTTRADVSTVSGRGVGLDVVRRSVRELRGDLVVERPESGGTRFVMRLPLTVAVVPSVIIEAAGETLALPASHVARTLRLDQVDRVGRTDVVRDGEELLPLTDPGRLFGWGSAERGDFGVVLRQGRRGAVLATQRLVDQRDLVVKALPRYGQRPPGVSGASVLPGGRVILLLDPLEIIELNEGQRRGGRA